MDVMRFLLSILTSIILLVSIAKADVFSGLTPWGMGPQVNITKTTDIFFADGGTVYIWLNYTCTGSDNCTTLTVSGNFSGIGGSQNRSAVFISGDAGMAYYEINETVNLSAIPGGIIGIQGGNITVNATATGGNFTIDGTGVALVNMSTIPRCPPNPQQLPPAVFWNGAMRAVNSCNLNCPVQTPIYQIKDTHVDLCPPQFGGDTTNFTAVAATGNFSAVNLVIDVPGKAKINFTTPVDMSNQQKAGAIMKFAMENLMSGGRVGINESEWNGVSKPNLNLSAVITIYNVTSFLPITNGDYSIAYGSYNGFEAPTSMQPCPPSRCPTFSFDGENITFTVTSWSTYVVGSVLYQLVFSNLTAIEKFVNQGVNATYLLNISNAGNNTNEITYNISVQGFGYINATQIKLNSTGSGTWAVIQLNVSNATEGIYLSNITAVLSDNSSIRFNSYEDGLNRNIQTVSDNTAPRIEIFDYTNETFRASNLNIELKIKVTDGSSLGSNNCTIRVGNSSSTNNITISSGWCNVTVTVPSDLGANGNKIINVTISDIASNLGFNDSYTLRLDNVAPSASLSLSPSSVTAGNAISITCSYSDDYSGVASTSLVIDTADNKQYSYSTCPSSFSQTFATGTYTLTYTVTDNAGNSASATASFTSKLSGGGGGGGGTTIEVKPTFTMIVPEVDVDKAAKVTLTKIKYDEIGVKEIIIEVNNKANDIRITVTKLDEKPASVTHEISGKVYRYLEITKTNIDDRNIVKGKIEFKVDKLWINENRIDKKSVTLNRYTSKGWEGLFTEMLSEDDDYVYYLAETTGFSVFAISGEVEKPPTTVPQTTTTTAPTTTTISTIPKPPIRKTNYLPYILIILLAIGAVVFALKWFREPEKTKKI